MTTQNAARTHARTEHQLTRGTLGAAVLAVFVAQVAMAIPAVLQGLFQNDLGTSSSQLTWISAAFLVPVTLLELSCGVLGDLFGRKRLMIIGSAMLAVGEGVALLTPGLSSSTGTRVLVLWTGMIIAGAGAAAILPTSLAMIAAGTHTAQSRARGITMWRPPWPPATWSPRCWAAGWPRSNGAAIRMPAGAGLRWPSGCSRWSAWPSRPPSRGTRLPRRAAPWTVRSRECWGAAW